MSNTEGAPQPETDLNKVDWDAELNVADKTFNDSGLNALTSVGEGSTANPQPPQNPNLAPDNTAPQPEVQPPAASPQPRPVPKPRPPKAPSNPQPSPKPAQPQPTPPQPPKPQPTPPQPPAPKPAPIPPKLAAANNPVPAPASNPSSGFFETVLDDYPEKTVPNWDPTSGKKPSREQVKSIESDLEAAGSNLARDVEGFADETIETENGPVLLYDNDVLQAVINSNVDPADRAAVEKKANDILAATVGRKNYQLSDEQRDEALDKIALDIEHVAVREQESIDQSEPSYKDELTTKIDAYRLLQSDLAQAKAARQSKIGNSIRKTVTKVKGFKPGLLKNTKELREQKEQLAYMGRGYGAKVKKLAGIESKPTDKNGNPAPFRYDHRDIIGILKDEKNSNRADTSQGELVTWLSNKNGGITVDANEVANDLRNELQKLRSKLGKYDSDSLDKISAEVDSYKQLKAEIETRQDEYKKDYGRIGSAALGGIKVVWGGAATAGYATKKILINPMAAANIERTKKWAPAAKVIGAVAVPALVVGVGLITRRADIDFSSLGNDTKDFLSDLLNINDEQPDATSAENDSDKVTSGGLGDHIDAGKELRGLGPDPDYEAVDDTPGKVVAPETGEYTGELNSETGLMEGTASDSTARAVIDLGVDYPTHQEDPEFQNDLYRLAVDSLEAQGVDQYEMPDNYQLELDKDSLQDFMDKWGPEEAPATTDDANGSGDNPPQSVRTTDFSAEGGQDSNIEAGQENTSVDDIIDKISEIIPGFNPELISDFKDSIMANPNMIAAIYSGTPIAAQEALNYANIHNSLLAPPIDHGYAQFIDNIQRLMREFLEDES